MPMIFAASQNAMTEIFDVWPEEAHTSRLTIRTMAPAISSYPRLIELRDRCADHIQVVRRTLEIESCERHALGTRAR